MKPFDALSDIDQLILWCFCLSMLTASDSLAGWIFTASGIAIMSRRRWLNARSK